MRDIGLVKHDEPITRLFTQGMVQKGGVAMSKSRGNVVGAMEMAEQIRRRYPAGFTQLFRRSAREGFGWSEESIEGAWRFINRVFRLVDRHAHMLTDAGRWNFSPQGLSEKERDLVRATYELCDCVTSDFESRWHFQFCHRADHGTHQRESMPGNPLKREFGPEIRKEMLEVITLMYWRP